MKRVNADIRLTGHVADIVKSQVGNMDPKWNAIKQARHGHSAPTSPDARSYSYEAHDIGGAWRVTSESAAVGIGSSVEEAVASVNTGGFEEKRVADWREVRVEDALGDRFTVADLRKLGREHDVSYSRGSTKSELVEQFVTQAPDTAFELAAP